MLKAQSSSQEMLLGQDRSSKLSEPDSLSRSRCSGAVCWMGDKKQPRANEGRWLGWCQPWWELALPAGWEHSGEGEQGWHPASSLQQRFTFLGAFSVLKAR